MASGKATITDVAARAGVSIKTVSRVMNREPNVRAGTRERVREAAAALGYEPNPAARGLASRRTFSLGLLYENPHEFSYTQRAFEGVFANCASAGYTLLLLPCGADGGGSSATDSALHLVTHTRVDGVILTAPLCDDERVLTVLRERDTPTARIAPSATDGLPAPFAPAIATPPAPSPTTCTRSAIGASRSSKAIRATARAPSGSPAFARACKPTERP